MKLRTKLLAAFSAILLLCGIATGVALYGLVRLRHENAVMDTTGRLVQATLQVQQFLTDASATHDRGGLREADTWTASFQRDLARLGQLQPERRTELETLATDFDAYDRVGRQMADAYITQGIDAGNRLMTGANGRMGFDQVSKSLQERLQGSYDAAAKTVQIAVERTLAASLVALALAIVLGFGIAFVFSGRLVKTIRELQMAASELAAGHLDQHLEIHSHDELGDMAHSFQETIAHLGEVIEQVNSAAHTVASSADQIGAGTFELSRSAQAQATAAEQTAGSMSQMAATIEQVASNAQSLAQNVDETSSSIEQMAANITQVARHTASLSAAVEQTSARIEEVATAIVDVARHAEQANESARHASTLAEGGKAAVEQTKAGMVRIDAAMADVVTVIQALGASSEAIGAIIAVIDDIAEQTNLLALNAAIEAARAGDHGRGFAVVADEVRKLAERSTKATGEIASLIKGVQKEAERAMASTQEGEAAIHEGSDLAQRAGCALEEIVGSVSEASRLIEQIRAATSEQSSATEQITQAVSHMRKLTQQVTEATREQAQGSEQIVRSVDRMNGMTQQVSVATSEQKKGGDQVVFAVESINRSVQETAAATSQIAQVATDLQTEARGLLKAIGFFQVGHSADHQRPARLEREKSPLLMASKA